MRATESQGVKRVMAVDSAGSGFEAASNPWLLPHDRGAFRSRVDAASVHEGAGLLEGEVKLLPGMRLGPLKLLSSAMTL